REVGARWQAQVAAGNGLAGEIAALSAQIAAAGGKASPDLLDQRALRVDKLVSLVGGNTVEQDDGSLNVFTPGGQAMVLGQASMALSTVTDPYRPDRVQIALESPGGATQLPASALSGQIGGRDRKG